MAITPANPEWQGQNPVLGRIPLYDNRSMISLPADAPGDGTLAYFPKVITRE